MPAGVLERLNLDYAGFSKAEKRIARYIIEHYDKAAFMNARQLAEAAEVSESTIIRFAYHLGYSGYPKMRQAIADALQNRMTTVERLDLMDGLSPEEVFRTSFEMDMRNLRMTRDKNTPQLIDAAADVMDGARTVYLLGTRSSWPLVQFADYYLRYMMDNVSLIRFEGSDVYSQTLHAGPDDALLAISFPRYSRMTVDAMQLLKDRGLPIITITDRRGAPPAMLSDYVLLAKSDMNSFVDSFVAPLALINILIIKLGLKRRDILFRNFAELEEAWKKNNTYAAGIDSRNGDSDGDWDE